MARNQLCGGVGKLLRKVGLSGFFKCPIQRRKLLLVKSEFLKQKFLHAFCCGWVYQRLKKK